MYLFKWKIQSDKVLSRIPVQYAMEATSGARTANPSGGPEFTPVFSGSHVALSLGF